MKKLNEEGIEIKRRTIAKYRSSLRILPAHLRRKSTVAIILFLLLCRAACGGTPEPSGLRARATEERVSENYEFELLAEVEKSWDSTIRKGNSVNLGALEVAFKKDVTPVARHNFAAALKTATFKGDVYRVSDASLEGRFWLSPETTDIYFGRQAFEALGPDEIIALLTDVQTHINAKDISAIRALEKPKKQVAPVAVATTAPASPVASPAQVPSPQPEQKKEPVSPIAAPVAMRIPAPITTGPLDISIKADIQTLTKKAFDAKIIPNTYGTVLAEPGSPAVSVWLDAADSNEPCFSFIIVDLRTQQINLRIMPLLPDPRIFPDSSQINRERRYKSDVDISDIDKRLERKYPKISKVSRELSKDIDLILADTAGEKQRWLSKVTLALEGILQGRDSHIDKTRQRHPEVDKIVGIARRNQIGHRRLIHKIEKARHYLSTHATGDGKVSPIEAAKALEIMDDALATWPRVQAGIRQYRNELALGDPDEMENLSFCEAHVSKVIPTGIYTQEILGFAGCATSALLTDAYYDARCVAYLEDLRNLEKIQKRLKLPFERLDLLVRNVYRLGNQVLALACEEVFTVLAEERATPLRIAEEPANYPMGGVGILLLDAQNQPRRFIPGGGGFSIAFSLRLLYRPFHIAEWYSPGDKIVLVNPSLTEYANFEQVTAYIDDWLTLQGMLPGNPEVWLGTSTQEGAICIYRPVEPNNLVLAERILGKTLFDDGRYQYLCNYLNGKFYALPTQEVSTLVGRLARSVGRTFGKRLPGKKVVRNRTRQVDPIYSLASNLPSEFQNGLCDFFGDEMGRRIMREVNRNFGQEFESLRKRAQNLGPEDLYTAIFVLARTVQTYIAEYLGRSYLTNNEFFTEVEIPGLTSHGHAGPGLSPMATADEITQQAENLAKQAMRHPRYFPKEQAEQIRAFAEEWVRQVLETGNKTNGLRYIYFQQAWLEAQQKTAALAQEINQELLKLAASVTHQDASSVQNAHERANQIITQLNPQRDADVIKLLRENCKTLEAAFARRVKEAAMTPHQKRAEEFLKDPKYKPILAQRGNRKMGELLEALASRKPFKGDLRKVGIAATKSRNISASVRDEYEFYSFLVEVAESSI